MPSIRTEDLTLFGRLALRLDREFSELARFGGELARVNIESDHGLDEGIRILNRVAQCGTSIAQTMQEFSNSLQEAREKAEAATKVSSERAQLISRRRQKQDELEQKLEKVKEDITAFGAEVAGSRGAAKGGSDDKSLIKAELDRLQAPMARFIEAAQAIKAEAAGSNFKRLERQTESVIDSLQASLRKIKGALASDKDA